MVKSTEHILDKNIEVFQFFLQQKNEINFETIPISSTNKQRKHELQNMSLIFFTHLIPISVSFQPSYVYNNHPDKCEKTLLDEFSLFQWPIHLFF